MQGNSTGPVASARVPGRTAVPGVRVIPAVGPGAHD